MEDALSALHMRHAAYRLCSRLGVTSTAAELASQLASGVPDLMLGTQSVAAICQGIDTAQAAGAASCSVHELRLVAHNCTAGA